MDRDLTVMTRNLCLGVDLEPLLAGLSGLGGAAAVEALGHATHALREARERTAFSARAPLLAAEIRTARPHVVGLQEVALWRTGPADPASSGVPDATVVDEDFLALLMAHLDGYRVAVRQVAEDVEATSFAGPRADRGPTLDVRLTIADVLLVRADVEPVSTGGGHYRACAEVSLGEHPLRLVRGYVWADVVTAPGVVRVVDTHLESVNGALAAAQAEELRESPALSAPRVVVIGDLNSAPGDPATSGGYDVLTGSGLTDLCPDGAPTFGFSATLDDASPAFDQRIDHVLGRGVGPLGTALTGLDVRDASTGLWASDHAGLVAHLAVL